MRINRIAMVLLFLMGIYILAASGTVLCANLVEMAPDQVLETMKDCLVKEAAANIYPGMFIPEEKEQEGTFSKWYAEMVLRMHPLMRLQAGIRENGGSENLATYEMLIQGGVHDENELDESGQEYDLASLAEQENVAASRQSAEETEQTVQEPPIQEPKEDRLVSEEQPASHMGTIYNLEELSDYEYLLSHFYTVEPTTAVTAPGTGCGKTAGRGYDDRQDSGWTADSDLSYPFTGRICGFCAGRSVNDDRGRGGISGGTSEKSWI